MATDRIIQLVTVLAASVLLLVAGRMLPRIIDSAGEAVVLVEVTKGTDDEEVTVERIPVSALRELTTVTANPAGGVPHKITFDAGGKVWDGHFGDLVDTAWLEDNTRRTARGLLVDADGFGLRYTDIAIEGAPPIVALGTAMGALRGLVVDYLWIRVNMMKEKGLFFDVMSDADLITKLQPRFGEVWAFHGHNMAYNISVLTNTPEERWEWVREGIDLVRLEGLRYNPNDVVLHKELAFWFSHKIDGVADDAHLYYKRVLAREWQYLLGEPPPGHTERIEWIGRVANAPETLDELYQRNPATRELIAGITTELSTFEKRFQFSLDANFLLAYGQWRTVKDSPYARLLDLEQQLLRTDGEVGSRLQNRLFQVFDTHFGDPARKETVDAFIAFLRRKVLNEAYNMDARLMWQYTRDAGPLDWRHPAAHAMYWARRGGQLASLRYAIEDNISKIVNNDRIEIQAMQALARSGIISYDAVSNDNPTRLSDPRWIKLIERYFHVLHAKFFHVPGGIPDSFTNFHENFMKQAVRELFRMGDRTGAEEVFKNLDSLYGMGGLMKNNQYSGDLEQFVQEVTFGEYEQQPEVARSDVYAALRRGFREGLLLDPSVLKEADKFAHEVTVWFREQKSNDFINKLGEKRMADLLGSLESSRRDVFRDVLLDTTTSLTDRLIMYNRASEADRRMVYDLIKPFIEQEFKATPLARTLTLEQAIPEPPGMVAYREEQRLKSTQPAEIDKRDAFERK
ncbi:MAG: hypothetical protein SGJ11_02630 [Phycisphaerae bacterium]|nr:hypothetical protein [Phycisphaerae bacterium]